MIIHTAHEPISNCFFGVFLTFFISDLNDAFQKFRIFKPLMGSVYLHFFYLSKHKTAYNNLVGTGEYFLLCYFQ